MKNWRVCLDEAGTVLGLKTVGHFANYEAYFGRDINRHYVSTPKNTFAVLYVHAVDELGAFAVAMSSVEEIKRDKLWGTSRQSIFLDMTHGRWR